MSQGNETPKQYRVNKGTYIPLILLAFSALMVLSACDHDADLALLYEVSGLIRDQHYDPNLHGLDWEAIESKYEAAILNKAPQTPTITIIDQMMQELGDSHCGLIALSDAQQAKSPYLFGQGSPGLDIRIIAGQAVVTRVKDGSPAARAGIRQGYILNAIDNQQVEKIVNKVSMRPPRNKANEKYQQTEAILWMLMGPPGTMVSIDYMNEDDMPKRALLKRMPRSSSAEFDSHIPEIVLEEESRILEGGINYLAFNAFQPGQPTHILTSIDSFDRNNPIVIDLRGNNGGSVNATIQLLSYFAKEPFLAFHRQGRDDKTPFHVQPVNPQLDHQTVVLVDEMSVSAAENFAAIMQKNKLATIIGAPTPGQLLWGEGFALRDDVMAVVPVAEIIYPDGRNIEGQGVVPDMEVHLNRAGLLMGIDAQLDAAINLLQRY